MDLADYKQAFAQGMLGQAVLFDRVELRCADTVALTEAADERFDFVLLDIRTSQMEARQCDSRY